VRPMAKAKYWVKIGDEWYPCALAKRKRGSRLHFDLYDGSGGVAMRGEWKVAEKPATRIETHAT
jgi:hypothetical protein